jgi:uncharacterized protein (AIM24 family)
MRSPVFDADHLPVRSAERFALQNSRMVRVGLGPDLLAAKGTMVGYVGQLQFHAERTGSIAKLAKKVVTSENVSLMRVSGRGEVWLAQEAGYTHLLELEDEGISVNARNLMAFDATLSWDINRARAAGIMGGGLFNTTVGGRGTVVVNVVGKPLVLDCSQRPVHVDAQSAVCWSASLSPGVQSSMNGLRGGAGLRVEQPALRLPGRRPDRQRPGPVQLRPGLSARP